VLGLQQRFTHLLLCSISANGVMAGVWINTGAARGQEAVGVRVPDVLVDAVADAEEFG